jgi:hypothetical protein
VVCGAGRLSKTVEACSELPELQFEIQQNFSKRVSFFAAGLIEGEGWRVFRLLDS